MKLSSSELFFEGMENYTPVNVLPVPSKADKRVFKAPCVDFSVVRYAVLSVHVPGRFNQGVHMNVLLGCLFMSTFRLFLKG